MKNILILSMYLVSMISGYAQQITWTGNIGNNNFFDEGNWKNNSTDLSPAANTINPGQAINFDLIVSAASNVISANGIINLGTGSLAITSSTIEAIAISGGSLVMNNNGYFDLSSVTPFQNNVSINFTSGIAWVRTLNLKGASVFNDYLTQIKVNNQTAVYKTNLRLDNYYLNGTVIRSNDLGTAPLTIYDAINLQGNNTGVAVNTVFSGETIPSAMNNKTESFLLKKGYMVTFAITEDGTGKSKNYIAIEQDLIINKFPTYLANDISFIRVLPWNWVTKRGRTTNTTELNNTWSYLWNNNGESNLEQEYAPMSWGAGGANDDADITLYKSKYKATHVMAFNESDNCADQSGQYLNLCQTDVAVGYYKNLMKSGLRLVSPSCREDAPFGWLKEFHNKANAQDVRIDVIAVHWYDWGSNPANSQNADPLVVFNRFKKYLQDVYNLYHLPIWISEFNANPNRSNATNFGFMQLALPYLETLDYVERYCWYQPNSGVADFYDASGTTLTNVGVFYRDQISTPSITESILADDSNLDLFYKTANPNPYNLLVNGYFETGDLTGWNGANIGTITPPFEGATAGRILANTGNIYQIVSVDSNANYDLSFYTKWFATPSAPISVKILNATTSEVISTKLMTTSLTWNLVELNFNVPQGVNSIKIIVEKGNEPGWFIDNALLLKTNQLGSIDFEQNSLRLFPNPSKGSFTIGGKSLIKSYSIHSTQGQLVAHENDISQMEVNIDMNDKTKGVYFLTLKDVEGKQHLKKIILN